MYCMWSIFWTWITLSLEVWRRHVVAQVPTACPVSHLRRADPHGKKQTKQHRCRQPPWNTVWTDESYMSELHIVLYHIIFFLISLLYIYICTLVSCTSACKTHYQSLDESSETSLHNTWSLGSNIARRHIIVLTYKSVIMSSPHNYIFSDETTHNLVVNASPSLAEDIREEIHHRLTHSRENIPHPAMPSCSCLIILTTLIPYTDLLFLSFSTSKTFFLFQPDSMLWPEGQWILVELYLSKLTIHGSGVLQGSWRELSTLTVTTTRHF